MDVQIDQDRADAVVHHLLELQTPRAREQLLALLSSHPVTIWTGDGRDEDWVFSVDGVGFGRVHRSQVEAFPRWL